MNMLAKVKGIGRQKRRSGWRTTRVGGASKGDIHFKAAVI
jgi:hypothetical protein